MVGQLLFFEMCRGRGLAVILEPRWRKIINQKINMCRVAIKSLHFDVGTVICERNDILTGRTFIKRVGWHGALCRCNEGLSLEGVQQVSQWVVRASNILGTCIGSWILLDHERKVHTELICVEGV